MIPEALKPIANNLIEMRYYNSIAKRSREYMALHAKMGKRTPVVHCREDVASNSSILVNLAQRTALLIEEKRRDWAYNRHCSRELTILDDYSMLAREYLSRYSLIGLLEHEIAWVIKRKDFHLRMLKYYDRLFKKHPKREYYSESANWHSDGGADCLLTLLSLRETLSQWHIQAPTLDYIQIYTDAHTVISWGACNELELHSNPFKI